MPRKKEKKVYKPLTAETISVQKTDDTNKRNSYYKRVGKVYGLGVIQFQIQLFEINETLPRMKKMTDEEIRRQIIQEFSHYQDTKVFYEKTKRVVVETRQRYNRGRMVPKEYAGPPPVISFRYDVKGNQTHWNKIMTPDAVERYKAHWTAYHIMTSKELGVELIKRDWMLPANHPLVLEELQKTHARSERSKKQWKTSKLRQKMKEEER